ncbi:sensor histidine kinase [Actinomadura chibensis]|uniref:histidine kinase n=1 Tax=Actinomadura chibensis TaxID=392828 RepID=A0A5D0NTT9_9ACTN|nr:sensor histidine kinase [Actinomadura chibensis]TYB47765.1 hypothetical protein FXF69_00435 [Actinomadura chibensis]
MRTDENARQWPRIADWGVPFLVAGSQITLTWLFTDGSGDPLGTGRWAAVATTIVLAAGALAWRRVAPVPVLAAAVALTALGLVASGAADTAIGGPADGVALYSLAVLRGPRAAVLGCLAACAAASAAYLPAAAGPGDALSTVLLNAALYLGITAFGQLRRQHVARRRELCARLADVDREARAAAEAERERLAREVHDVAGHHLSAVVVHTGAAVRIGDPGLVREALTVAAETGREVLGSLSALADLGGPRADGGGLRDLLPGLCHGLARMGVPVSLALEGRARRLPAEVTAVAYRIVQESLTNATRHAFGAEVRVTVRYEPGAVRVSVENERPGGAAARTRGGGQGGGQGGGRGVRGMRGRAAELGGALTAGPTAAGGWAVEARLPTTTGSRIGWGWPEVLDAVAVVLCAASPVLAFVPPEPLVEGAPAAGTALAAAVLMLGAVPLWWRRRRPRAALAAVVSAQAVFAAACALWSPDALGALGLGCPALFVAVYSVACYHPGGRRTWPAALAAPLPWGIGLGLTLAADRTAATGAAIPVAFAFGLATAVVCAAPATFAAWAWGLAAAARSRRWGDAIIDTVTTRTGTAVHAERIRVAAGLNGTVLDRTARLVTTAESGLAGPDDAAAAALRAVTGQARAALTEMRGLLDAMERDGEGAVTRGRTP